MLLVLRDITCAEVTCLEIPTTSRIEESGARTNDGAVNAELLAIARKDQVRILGRLLKQVHSLPLFNRGHYRESRHFVATC